PRPCSNLQRCLQRSGQGRIAAYQFGPAQHQPLALALGHELEAVQIDGEGIGQFVDEQFTAQRLVERSHTVGLGDAPVAAMRHLPTGCGSRTAADPTPRSSMISTWRSPPASSDHARGASLPRPMHEDDEMTARDPDEGRERRLETPADAQDDASPTAVPDQEAGLDREVGDLEDPDAEDDGALPGRVGGGLAGG